MSATWSPVLSRPFSRRRQAIFSARLASWAQVRLWVAAPRLLSRVNSVWSAVAVARQRRISAMNWCFLPPPLGSPTVSSSRPPISRPAAAARRLPLKI